MDTYDIEQKDSYIHLKKKIVIIINGKGGGSKTLAQGVGDIDKLEEFLNAIVKELSQIAQN